LEDIIEVLQGLTGETRDTIYDLFFTGKRIIAAIVLHHSDLTKYWEPNLLTRLLGGGFKYQEAKMRSAALVNERRVAFKSKSLDEILTMHRANTEISYNNIASVIVRKRLLTASLEFKVQDHPEKKMTFFMRRGQVDEVQRVIGKILPKVFLGLGYESLF